MSKHFTITTSQSTQDKNDLAIHYKEENQQEKLAVHCKFTEVLSESEVEELVSALGRQIGKTIAKRVKGSTQQLLGNEEKSWVETRKIITKMQEVE